MIDFLDLCRAAGYGSPITSDREVTMSEHVARGYFSLGDHDQVVHVTSTADFLLYIWGRNTETAPRGVQVTTPASEMPQFNLSPAELDDVSTFLSTLRG